LPGKVNVNGIRHIEVYAGLIDDAFFADVPPYNIPGAPGSGVDTRNRFMPFMSATSAGISGTSTVVSVPAAGALTPTAAGLTYRDRWFEFLAERDGATRSYDPIQAANTTFWIPGTPAAKPFRSLGHRTPDVNTTTGSDVAGDDTILRRSRSDIAFGQPLNNRNWLEVGTPPFHTNPDSGTPPAAAASTQRERHQILAKLFNNTSTVSDSFIIYGTAAYFQAYEDPASGLIRVGGRMGLDLDGNGTETDDAGWERRAVFIVDRTELLNAYDEGTGNFDWQRLIKYRADLASDGQ
jgi:hypothetical protein